MSFQRLSNKMWWLVIAYAVTHLLFLTKLPIFADEAIYLRWAQVAYREPAQYAFLPMLDGKPPLHVWMLIPFTLVFQDPLFAGRLLSVLAGLGLVCVMYSLARAWEADEEHAFLAALMTAFLPWWFFYARLSLADMVISLSFAVSLLASTQLLKTKSWKHGIVLALSFASALWMKTGALFFVPIYAVFPLVYAFTFEKKKLQLKEIISLYKRKTTFILGVSAFTGLVLFGLLRLHPLFPSLFSRSADYSFTIVSLLQGDWKQVLMRSLPNSATWLIWYATPLAAFSIFFLPKKGKAMFFLGTLIALPFIILGKVLYPRYLLPAMVPFTIALAFGFQELQRVNPNLRKFLFQGTALCAVAFILLSYINPARMPLLGADKEQYVSSWAAGYGTKESWEYLKARAQQTQKKILVVTEGYFGSLPDGLQVYADRDNVGSLVEIHGIGQPIENIPEWVLERSTTQEVYVLANEDRFRFSDESYFKIVQSYPREGGAPLLLIKIGKNVRDEK